jgi:hypothetical protein
MAEWLKAHAWKACVPQGTVGSNPTLSASKSLYYSNSFNIKYIDDNPSVSLTSRYYRRYCFEPYGEHGRTAQYEGHC